MGNTNAAPGGEAQTETPAFLAELEEFFSWCGGGGRRPEGGDIIFPPEVIDNEDRSRSYKTPDTLRSRSVVIDWRSANGKGEKLVVTPVSSQRRKSTAELAEVGMPDGEVKQRIIKLSTLDDALADNLIDEDQYARSLNRMQSLIQQADIDDDKDDSDIEELLQQVRSPPHKTSSALTKELHNQ